MQLFVLGPEFDHWQCLSPGMHAPARPAPAPGEMAAPGRPGPENFQLCPAPEITPGQESGQTFLHHQKFLGVKNF